MAVITECLRSVGAGATVLPKTRCTVMVTPEEFRRQALSLPEVEERETWGHPTFRVRDKIFATMAPRHDGVGVGAGLKASLEEQAELIASYPDTFAVAKYTGRYGWVSVKLATADPNLMQELIVNAWRQTAPKRLVKAYDTP